MLRIRFYTKSEDPRPINWPIKHPYWISGEGENHFILISYADDVEYIYKNWPEATNLDIMDTGIKEYVFTDRFPRPEWFKEEDNNVEKV